MAIVAGIALASLAGAGEGAAGAGELVVVVGALFALTIGFSYYALSRFPSFHLLPGVWAVLALVEFVVSPAYDILYDQLGAGTVPSAESLSAAFGVCGLFVAGLWAGVAVAHSQTHGGTKALSGQIATYRATPVIVAFAMVSLATELFILSASGAFSGSIVSARFEGLIGTSALMPLVRLVNVGTLLGSWLSVVEVRAAARRRYFRLALMSAAVALLMPLVLQQRFGLLQAVGYLVLPLLAAGKILTRRRQKMLYIGLGLLLIGVWVGNELSAALRGSIIANETFRIEDALVRNEGMGATHFRHLRLLAVLMDRGVDEPSFGGLYEGHPFVGDLLIILPRKLFPNKPVTTAEVINGVAHGEVFTALDRGRYSVHTTSLWIQLYVLGGRIWIFPLAFAFSCGSVLLMDWIARRPPAAMWEAVGGVLWFTFGWLGFNVALLPMEIPGMFLAVLCLRAFSISNRASEWPGRCRGGGWEARARGLARASAGATVAQLSAVHAVGGAGPDLRTG
ncbi:MAG: hypothetical protein KBB14_04335 [Thermoanaerobaculia bacterium]|nr:hypothetical protein [Thermoanaerobaculia bacterium]